jgi:hypothetical protein
MSKARRRTKKRILIALRKTYRNIAPHFAALFDIIRSQVPKRLMVSVGFIVLAALAVVVLATLTTSNQGFPVLAPGMYVGTLELAGPVSTPPSQKSIPQKSTLFIEKRQQQNSVLVVVLRQGFQPTAVPLFYHPGQTQEDSPKYFQSLEFELDNRRIRLSGSLSGNESIGAIKENNAVVGSWRLRPLSEAENRLQIRSDMPQEWLISKGTHRLRQEELELLQKRNLTLSNRVIRLSALATSPESLQKGRQSYATELQTELTSLRETHENYASRIAELVREINQLERITLAGQVATLARRVSSREDKWYGVNWADAQSADADEQRAAEAMGIDLRSLSQQIARAQEIQNLRSEIAVEQSKIRKLRREYDRKKELGSRPATPPNPTPQQPGQQQPSDTEEKKPWWQRLDVFSVFITGEFRP